MIDLCPPIHFLIHDHWCLAPTTKTNLTWDARLARLLDFAWFPSSNLSTEKSLLPCHNSSPVLRELLRLPPFRDRPICNVQKHVSYSRWTKINRPKCNHTHFCRRDTTWHNCESHPRKVFFSCAQRSEDLIHVAHLDTVSEFCQFYIDMSPV